MKRRESSIGYLSLLVPGKTAWMAAAVVMGHGSVHPSCVAGKLKIVCCCGEQRGTGEAGGPVGGGAMLTAASVCPHISAHLLGFSCRRVARNLLLLHEGLVLWFVLCVADTHPERIVH